MANNSDVTIRGLQIAAELNIDASADIISGQLNELATKVNNGSQKLKLNVEVDQEQASVIAKQINTQAQAAQTHVKPVNVDLTFNRGDLVAAEKQIVSLVEKMAAAKDGFSVAGYDTRFNADKTAIDATVSYYEKGSSQILRDHYQLTKGIEGAEDTITLVWTSIGANVKRENDKYIAELNRAANAQDALYQKANAFTSKMSASAFDPNKNTNVLGAGNIDEIRSTYDEIIALRDKLNARGENGQILNSSEIQEAKVQLSDLTIKLTEYIAKAQNASKYAQSMKPVDITAGAIKSMQDVEKLALDIKSAGVNAEYLQKEVANLYTALQTVSTPAGLQTIDEQIKILIADFQIAKKESSIKSREENAKLAEIASLNKQVDAFVAKLKQAGLYTGSFPQDVRALRAEIEGIPSQTILPSGEYVDGIKSKLTGLVGTYDQIISRQQIENEKFQQYYNLVSQKNALEKQLVGVSGNPNKANEEANIRDRIAAKDKEINDARAKINLSEAQLIKLIAQEQVQREKIGSEQAKVADITEKQRISQQAADRQANAERDRALATLKLMEAQYPKMKGTAFQAQFDGIEQGLQDQTMSGEEANVQFVMLRENLQAAGLAGQTFGQKITAAFQKFGQYVTVSTIVLSGIRATKQMISNVVELDTSLVEFNKVADLTATQLEKITVEAFAMGESIGRTGKDVIDAATEFKRAGYDISESMDMARSALVMTNVGDGIEDTAEAASMLIAALRGFEKPASEVSSIVDLINQVSNTSPIAFEDIAEGLTRVAGTMHLTGTSIEETVGLLTGGFSQLRNIEKVSSGLIMISQKLRGVDEDGTSVDGLAAKVADEFEAVGVSVEDTNGELRSTFDILKDYAAVHDELGSKKIQFLGEEAAGNRQVTVLNAIMQQWEDVEKAVSQATNSVGSAEKENAIFMDSIRGRLNELKSAWQELSASVIDSGFVKWVVTAGKDILNVITSLSDNLGTIPTLGSLAGIGVLIKNLGRLTRGGAKWAYSYVLAS